MQIMLCTKMMIQQLAGIPAVLAVPHLCTLELLHKVPDSNPAGHTLLTAATVDIPGQLTWHKTCMMTFACFYANLAVLHHPMPLSCCWSGKNCRGEEVEIQLQNALHSGTCPPHGIDPPILHKSVGYSTTCYLHLKLSLVHSMIEFYTKEVIGSNNSSTGSSPSRCTQT